MTIPTTAKAVVLATIVAALPVLPGSPSGSDILSGGAEKTGAATLSHRAAPLEEVIEEYCVRCHSDRRLTGNLSLEHFDIASAGEQAAIGERVVHKLRAGMMPPPGERRPPEDTLRAVVEALEETLDAAAAENSNPGSRFFQRLNRAEYEASIRALLDLEVDAGDYLPLDTKSANFDNIADAQLMSPTVLDSYLRAADEISRLAVGVSDPSPTSVTYSNSGYVSQWERVPGAPHGTRGGISVMHNFPADAQYHFEMWFEHTTMGEMFGRITPGEQIEISIDGARVALFDVDRWLSTSDPNSASMDSEPIFIRGGPHRVTAAFISHSDGPVEDLTSPHEWSLVDRQVGVNGYGITALPHLKDLVILGPYNPTGLSDTPSRRAIFDCRPIKLEEERPCAESIVARLATEAFRGPVSEEALRTLMTLYDEGASSAGFEEGVRRALQGILAMPDFVFRLEDVPDDAGVGEVYPLDGVDLAARLSFFLWGAPPDGELIRAAREGELSDLEGLESQAWRMLADPRASALGSRFAAQWLRLDDLEKVHPDRLLFPDFHEQVADAMRRETELFFNSIVQEDRSVLELLTADYTFVNERLANHYGFSGVEGEAFRRIRYPNERRRGLLGQGSILTLTSHAGRTSPVLRGKWVMEVLLGTPPPPPPPNVPALEATAGSRDGRTLTTRERMELHRANPTCQSCHKLIDPIGLALDNFDVTGRWRIRENGTPLDTRGVYYDGTPIASPSELREVIVNRPIPFLRNFTSNLMAYALGRRVEYFDQPTVRQISRDAEAEGQRISAYILGVIRSDAFRYKRVAETTAAGSREY